LPVWPGQKHVTRKEVGRRSRFDRDANAIAKATQRRGQRILFGNATQRQTNTRFDRLRAGEVGRERHSSGK